jgi:hypothetical protein
MAIVDERLPDERLKAVSRATLTRSILLALALLVASNAALSWALLTHPVNAGYGVCRKKWELLEQLDHPVDYLILGDSSCNQGVDPKVIERVLGGSALNLCTIGDMLLVGDAWMLQAYVEKFGAPKAVIIGHVYDVWPRNDKNLKLSLWNIDAASHAWRDQEPRLALDLRSRFEFRVGAYFPMYSQPLTLSHLMRHPSGLFVESPRYAAGFMIEDKAAPGRVLLDTQHHLSALGRGRAFAISDINRKALTSIGRTASTFGFPVYFVHAPVYDRLHDSQAFQKHLGAINKLLASNGESISVLLPDAPHFRAQQMQNADHLVGSAARVYSQEIAEALQQRMQTARRSVPGP